MKQVWPLPDPFEPTEVDPAVTASFEPRDLALGDPRAGAQFVLRPADRDPPAGGRPPPGSAQCGKIHPTWEYPGSGRDKYGPYRVG